MPSTPRGRNSASRPRPFSYTDALTEVIRDIVATLDAEFRHVELDRVRVSFMRARQNSQHGTYASCFPMRFEGGEQEQVIQGRHYRMPTLVVEGNEILYVLYFMLPRFHEEQDYHGKIATIIHELYHISPQFNGDIRRFPGKNFAHGHSREVYHEAMKRLADRYLVQSPQGREHTFLQEPFEDLLKRPGGVVGRTVPRQHPVLVEKEPPKGKSPRSG